MREIFTYGSVGGAPGNRCFYPETDRQGLCIFLKWLEFVQSSGIPLREIGDGNMGTPY